MVDRVEASKNLELLKANQSRLMNYNHLYSSHAFRQDCGAELRKIGKQIASIEELLHEKPQKTRSNQKAAMHSVRQPKLTSSTQ